MPASLRFRRSINKTTSSWPASRAAATGVMPCLFAFSKSQGDSSSKTLIIAASPARAAAQKGEASNARGHTKS